MPYFYIKKTDIMPLVWLSCSLAALAGLLFGMDIGLISGALRFITIEFNLTPSIEGWIVGSMMFGAAIGAIIASSISSNFGRKNALLLSALLFFLGSLVAVLAVNINIVIIARIILGLAVGVASFTTPIYLSEIAPECIRGTMISLYQLMVTIGILIAFISNLIFSYIKSWRCMFGVLMVPAIILFIGVLIVPNSPRWLINQNRLLEARKILWKIRSSKNEIEYEIKEIKECISSNSKTNGFNFFKSNYNFRRSVFLGITLQIVQQFTGINIMMYFAPHIFELTGFNDTAAQLWSTAIIGLVNLLATFIAIAFVDSIGRKALLYTSFSIMSLGMAILGVSLHIGAKNNEFVKYTSMASLVIFVVGFAMAAGPIIWTLCAEIQPINGRDFGISCSTIANWLTNMLIGTFFLSILNNIGGDITFSILAIFNILFIIFTRFFVPETIGVSLEQIEKNLMSGKDLRKLGNKT
ncbi:Galactose-proton symporter [Candidatus Johnevansia muelleri]|uniref:Galactose-proton symporter n=1 Tax=Candidatus Johnevansia muelleri TaxID=1495769 RepID=A0A078KE74_9GAMM|nr:Galactose-proton symporter [Candidatus Evansia muelleri]